MLSTAETISSSPDLLALIERARAWFANATTEERKAHFAAQRKSMIAAEMAASNEGCTL